VSDKARSALQMHSTDGMSDTQIFAMGNLMLGYITDTEAGVQYWPKIAVGVYDAVLLHALFFAHYRRHPANGEEKSDVFALRGLENVKRYLKNIIQALLDPAESLRNPLHNQALMEDCKNGWRDIKADQKAAEQASKRLAQSTREAFKAQHAVAPEGTVAELAAKHGISKSEVRRLKAAGLLHTLGQP